MGRKDKHKAGQSRNHPVFKVMGNSGKVGNKGNNQKALEVKSKLKKITAPKNKSMAKDAIESLDSQFNSIQHDKAINISSTSTKVPKDKQKIAPMSGVLNQPEVDMDGLMTSMDKLKDKSEESK